MTTIEIVTPKGMFGSYSGEAGLSTAMRIIGVGFGDEGDWCAKYGTNYENDVFLMKRHCWCEKAAECPWCTGCAVYQDRGECPACLASGTHEQDCAQLEMQRRLQAAGFAHAKYGEDGRYIDHEWNGVSDDKSEKVLVDAFLVERGLTSRWEACDCAAKRAGHELREAGQTCPYNLGTGIFKRFAPWTKDKSRHYYDPPNFWFKPSDFRLKWYKYIGRDMVSNKDDLAADFMEQIFGSHPNDMTLEQAIQKTAAQEAETAASFTDMFASFKRVSP